MKFNFNKTANFDEENLDNIWVVDMWLDNMDSKDGHDHIEFTKIGLIDFLNNEIKDYNSTNGADYTVLDRNATNKEVKEVLYDLLEGKVVEIKPYNEKTANKKCAAVTKQIGRWLLKLVKAGETTNRGSGEFINKGEGDEYDIVEIYDTKAEPGKFTEYGQFVSSYYVSTFLKINSGLSMVGYVPAWTMSAAEVKEAQEWLKSLYPNGTPKDFLEEAMAEFRKKNKTAKKQIKAEEEPKTKIDVLFKLEKPEGIDGLDVVAWFLSDPDTCYSHNGQHSNCYPNYMASLEDAKFTDYEYLLKELENIGYEVNVMNGDYKQQKKASRKFTFNKASKEDSGLILDKEYANFNYSVGEDGTMYIYAPDGRTINEISDCEDKNTKELEDLMLEVLDNSSFSRFNKKNVSKKSSRKFTFNKKKAGEEVENYITVWLYPGSGASLYGFATVADNEEEALENVADYLVEKQLHSFYMTPQEYQDFMKDYYDELSEEELEEKMENDETVMYVDTGRGAVVYLTGFENAKIEKGINESYIDDIAIIDGSRAKSGPLAKWSNKSASKKVKAENEEQNMGKYKLEIDIWYYNTGGYGTPVSAFLYDETESEEFSDKYTLFDDKLFYYGNDYDEEDSHLYYEEFEDYVISTCVSEAQNDIPENTIYLNVVIKKFYSSKNVQTDTIENYFDVKLNTKKVKASAQVMSYTRKDKDEFVVKVADKEKDITADITVKVNGNDLSFDSSYQFPQDDDETLEDFTDTAVWFLVNKKLINFDGNNKWHNGKSASIKRKAGTSNFYTQDDYPLIAIGDDEVWPKESFVEWYNEENPDNKIDTWEQEDVEYYQLLPDLYDDFTIEMEHYLKNADIPEGWKITLKPGYYEGVQLWVEEPTDFEYYFEQGWLDDKELGYNELTPEQKAELQNAMQAQYEKEKAQVAQIMIDAAKACGWLQLKVDWRASNGETGYSVVKSGLSESGVEKLKQVSEVVETKNNIAILKSKMTGNYILFDYNTNDFLDDELYSDLASAESALEDYTEEIGNDILSDLADDLVLDIKDVKAVKEKLATVSKDNSDYGKIEEEQIADIARETGVNNTDVKTIALELGYMVK